MNPIAGVLAVLALAIFLLPVGDAGSAEPLPHTHELAETAPPAADAVDRDAQPNQQDSADADPATEQRAIAGKAQQGSGLNETAPDSDRGEIQAETPPQSEAAEDTGEPVTEHASDEERLGSEDTGDLADVDVEAREEGEASEPAPLTPLELCYQAIARETLSDSASVRPDTQPEPAGATDTQVANDVQEPYMLVRTLEILQDRIAAGTHDAHIYQRELIGKIAKKINAVPDSVWKAPKNINAAILYALSGGDPRILQKLLDLGPLPCADEVLLKGLLAYSKGDNEAAKTLLMHIDPRVLDNRVAAHLSLAQAMLIATEAPKRAIGYLDLARLLAPGTLVEEAALRRESVIAALVEDFETFERLTSQYMRRFSKSVYAPEFLSRLAVAVATSAYATDDSRFLSLANTLSTLDTDQQRSVYAAIVQAAIVRGRIALTRAAADKLTIHLKGDPALALRASLYAAAVMIVTDEYDQGVKQLKSIDRALLPPIDQPILDAALYVADRMRLPPQIDESISLSPSVSAEQGEQSEFKQTPQLLDNARAAIGRADDILNGDR